MGADIIEQAIREWLMTECKETRPFDEAREKGEQYVVMDLDHPGPNFACLDGNFDLRALAEFIAAKIPVGC